MSEHDREPRGDLADLATASVFEAEEAAIRAALAGSDPADEAPPDKPVFPRGSQQREGV